MATVEVVKARVFKLLEFDLTEDRTGKAVDWFLITLIVLNIVVVILETEARIAARYADALRAFEVFSVAVFTLEYVLRLWSCTVNSQFKHPIQGRIKFALTPLALVDLLVILPFYLPLAFALDLRAFRVLRLSRLLRIFKMGRYSESLQTFGNVIRAKKEEVSVTLFIGFIMLILSSSLMYFVEHDAQPDKFPSIPGTLWWGVMTLTTVGYGDVYPITSAGKLLGALTAVLGIGLFVLPAGVLASGFTEELQRRKLGKRTCPHCGNEID